MATTDNIFVLRQPLRDEGYWRWADTVMLSDSVKCEFLNFGSPVCLLTGGANIQTTGTRVIPMRHQEDGEGN